MSIEAAIVQYRKQMVDQYEVRTSVLRVGTTKETVLQGNQATFLVAGSGTDTAITRGSNGQIPYGNPTNTQVTATLVEKHAPYELTNFNIFASQGDQKLVMQNASMAVINRDMELTILAELANTTVNLGATGVQASNALIQKAIAKLGTNAVDVTQEDKMFAAVSPGWLAYMRQIPEFTSFDYVDMKTFSGAIKRTMRWNGVNWFATPLISGIGTASEVCFMWHSDAIGYAVNAGEESFMLGYDEKQATSWTRASIYHAAKVLQTNGIVKIVHDGSAYA